MLFLNGPLVALHFDHVAMALEGQAIKSADVGSSGRGTSVTSVTGSLDIQHATYPLIALARSQFGFLPSPSFDFKRFVAALRTIRFITTLAAPVCF